MKTRDPYLIRRALFIIGYEYGHKAADRLSGGDLMVEYNVALNRIKQLYYNGELAFTIRASDGYLLPTMLGAEFIDSHAVVKGDAIPFIMKGRNVPKSMVIKIVNARAGMDIAVRDEAGSLVAVGRLLISPDELRGVGRGFIIRIRQHRGNRELEDAVN